MSRKRKCNRHTNMENKPITSQHIPGPDDLINSEKPLQDLLFRPMIYKKNSESSPVDFDHIVVPFKIQENRVFMIAFMSSLGDTSVYTECYEMDPKKPCSLYRDAMSLMRECLKMEKLTGAEYYFGKLDKALKHYLYTIQLFIDRKLLDREQALAVIKELDVNTDDIIEASQSVTESIAEAQIRQEQMIGETRARSAANRIITDFITSVLDRKKNSIHTEDQTEE